MTFIDLLGRMQIELWTPWRENIHYVLSEQDREIIRSHPVIGFTLSGIHSDMVVRTYDLY